MRRGRSYLIIARPSGNVRTVAGKSRAAAGPRPRSAGPVRWLLLQVGCPGSRPRQLHGPVERCLRQGRRPWTADLRFSTSYSSRWSRPFSSCACAACLAAAPATRSRSAGPPASRPQTGPPRRPTMWRACPIAAGRPPTRRPLDLSAASPVEAGLAQMRAADSSFDPRTFAEGARGAFEMIVGAYAQGDTADASSAPRRRGLREFRRGDQSAPAGQADARNHAGRHQIGRHHRSAHGQPHRVRHGEVRQRADQRHARCRAAPWSKAIRSRSLR